MRVDDIEDEIDAACYLMQFSGRTIIDAEHAAAVAEAFGVELGEGPGELQPLREIDRTSGSDELAIGIGDLARVICERLGLDPESGSSAGHGGYQDELAERNLPRLKSHILD